MDAHTFSLKAQSITNTYWQVLNEVAGTPEFKPDILALRKWGEDIRLAVIPTLSPRAWIEYRREGLYLSLCVRLEMAVKKQSSELEDMLLEVQRLRSGFRIGIFIFCTLPVETTLPTVQEKITPIGEPTANDRRFLRALRISADQPTDESQ